MNPLSTPFAECEPTSRFWYAWARRQLQSARAFTFAATETKVEGCRQVYQRITLNALCRALDCRDAARAARRAEVES